MIDFKRLMAEEFDMTDLGFMNYFLRLEMQQK